MHPGVSPADANDWSCAPSAERRSSATGRARARHLRHQFNSWAYLSPRLKAQGYCAFSFNSGKLCSGVGLGPEVYGTGPVLGAARELGVSAARVRAASGAPEVDLVGYSQGAIVAASGSSAGPTRATRPAIA